MKNAIYSLVTFMLISVSVEVSNATVIFVAENNSSFADNAPFTEHNVGPTDGDEGDFELLFCTTTSTGANTFVSAAPNWDFLNQGGCGGGPDCILGIWEKFSPQPNNVGNTCTWSVGTTIVAGIVFRYGGADLDNPVIVSACNSGIGNLATAPPLPTEAGSMVTRVFAADEDFALSFNNLPGSTQFGKILQTPAFINERLSLFVYNEPFVEAGLAPAASVSFTLVDTAWRACTIAVRMEGSSPFRQIPTLNEWGLLIFAAVAGLAGFWFIRRRSVAA